MKRRHPIIGLCALALLLLVQQADAAKFKRAEVTRLVNDVKLLTGTKTSRPASIGAVVSGSTAVRTGTKSRAELQFADESVVRLGSNSVFSFLQGKREVDLKKGTLLLQVPKSLGRTSVKTAAVSAAITGTTILVEHVPATPGKSGTIKIIVIEGSLEFFLNNAPRKKMKLRAGEMVAFRTDSQQLPQKFNIDILRLVKTSLLVDGGMGPLPFLEPIDAEIIAQRGDKRLGRLLSSNTRERRRLLDRLLPGKLINHVRDAANNRPRPPVTPPRTISRPQNNNTGGGGSVPAGGVQLPVRPNRNPPGTGP